MVSKQLLIRRSVVNGCFKSISASGKSTGIRVPCINTDAGSTDPFCQNFPVNSFLTEIRPNSATHKIKSWLRKTKNSFTIISLPLIFFIFSHVVLSFADETTYERVFLPALFITVPAILLHQALKKLFTVSENGSRQYPI